MSQTQHLPVILGLDPGLAALGVARVSLHAHTETVAALEVLTTSPSNRKQGVLATEDNVRRAQELAAALEQRITSDVVALASEAQSWPRNASSSAKVGQAWGVIAAVAQRHQLPVLQASPQEVKAALTGRKNASKAEVQVALEVRYPELPDWPPQKGLVEHASDALAAAVTCLDHPVVQMARRLVTGTCGVQQGAAGVPLRPAPPGRPHSGPEPGASHDSTRSTP